MNPIGIIMETGPAGIKETNAGPATLVHKAGAQAIGLIIRGQDQPGPETDPGNILRDYGITRVLDIVLPKAPEISQNPVVRADAAVDALAAYGVKTVLGLSGEKDLIPRIAARLDAPLVMDCMDLDLETHIAVTSQYSGKTLARIQVCGDTRVYGIRPNAVQPQKAPAPVEVIRICPDPAVPQDFKLIIDPEGPPDSDPGMVSLSEADIIIAGGRGMKNKENFDLLFQCAKRIKAAVGASRVAVDSGWIPYSHQVGQTGEKVSPAVYIACGISGSIQHFAGMKTAKIIIAVNQDENAAIVANSDYYAIGDLLEIIPELIRQS